jgi:hypothetical protein
MLCCAWIAAALVDRGYVVKDAETQDIIDSWAGRPVDAILGGKSAEYLRATGQWEDLYFILEHVDDLECVAHRVGGEIARVDTGVAAESVAAGYGDDHR